ncbi:MAG TPA: hypothetical protein VH255_01795 [Verrucomicrobiae bacterium]|nr:hypothetical protein [Verrucomicrobiae bacterium]
MNLRFTIQGSPSAKKISTLALCLLTTLMLCSCASTHPAEPARARKFDFQRDTFSFANGLLWEYHYTNGVATHQRRVPKPDYALHCFVVARSARQFFQNARFDSNQPPADDATYRKLVDRVVAMDPEHHTQESEIVVIPGYPDLHEFSLTHEQLLKNECGSVWRSYVQRGNWRMVFPFFRSSQENTAQALLAGVRQNLPPIAHLVRFPQETINHAVVVYDANETDKEVQFTIYDPNHPDVPGTLNYDRTTRTFNLPANNYFAGGKVNVYQIYRNLIY